VQITSNIAVLMHNDRKPLQIITSRPVMPPRLSRKRTVTFDVLRIGAALLVLIGHVRSAVFIPYEAFVHNRLLLAPFYAFTSMGSEAVMIFFVLSGYLVGGQVIVRLQEMRWSALDYAITRMTRLWIVILPTLAVTYLIDHLSMSLSNGSLYDGSYGNVIPSLPTPSAPGRGPGERTCASVGLAVLGALISCRWVCQLTSSGRSCGFGRCAHCRSRN
jgi:hypothetical protein